MHIITLPNQDQFEYLMYVFHNHVKSGIEPQELVIAGQVWDTLKRTQVIEPPVEEKEVVQIPGPLSIVHNGDMRVPVSPQQLAEMDGVIESGK